MSFTERLSSDYSQGLYANAKLSASSCSTLSQYAGRLARSVLPSNLTGHSFVEEDDYHCTIVYSRTPVNYMPSDLYPFEVDPKTYKIVVLGKSDGPKVLALKFNSEHLEERNRELEAAGATSDFPTFTAHITLIGNLPVDYKMEGEPYDVSFIGPLKFIAEQVRPLDPDFSYGKKKNESRAERIFSIARSFIGFGS